MQLRKHQPSCIGLMLHCNRPTAAYIPHVNTLSPCPCSDCIDTTSKRQSSAKPPPTALSHSARQAPPSSLLLQLTTRKPCHTIPQVVYTTGSTTLLHLA